MCGLVVFGERGGAIAPMMGEGCVRETVLVGYQGLAIFGVKGEVEVAGNEDAGSGVVVDVSSMARCQPSMPPHLCHIFRPHRPERKRWHADGWVWGREK